MDKGSQHSKEARLKMSKSRIGKKHSKETKMKISKMLKGKKRSEETKKKISKSHKGKKYPEKLYPNHGTRGKILVKKGVYKKCLICGKEFYTPLCLNKRKKYCSKKCSYISIKGKPSYNKGLTKETSDGVRRTAKAKIGKPRSKNTKNKIREKLKGRKLSKEHIKKMIGRNPWNKGLTKETDLRVKKYGKSGSITRTINGKNKKFWNKPKMIEFAKQRRAKQIFPVKDSSIELKIQNFLSLLHIEYFTHKYMKIEHGYQCDILIPKQETEGVIISQKTIIECDGDYFHMNPNKFKANDKCFKKGMTAKEKWKLDNSRTKELIEKGFKVIRLWEHEIKVMELNDLRSKING